MIETIWDTVLGLLAQSAEFANQLGIFSLVFGLLLIVAMVVRRAVRKLVTVVDTDNGRGLVNLPEEVERAIVRAAWYGSLILATLASLQVAGIGSGDLLTAFGFASLGAMLASAELFKHLIGGVIVALRNVSGDPLVVPGQWLEVGGDSGIVLKWNLLYTTVSERGGIENRILNGAFLTDHSIRTSGDFMKAVMKFSVNNGMVEKFVEIVTASSAENPHVVEKTAPVIHVDSDSVTSGSGCTLVFASEVAVAKHWDAIEWYTRNLLPQLQEANTLSIFDANVFNYYPDGTA